MNSGETRALVYAAAACGSGLVGIWRVSDSGWRLREPERTLLDWKAPLVAALSGDQVAA